MRPQRGTILCLKDVEPSPCFTVEWEYSSAMSFSYRVRNSWTNQVFTINLEALEALMEQDQP